MRFLSLSLILALSFLISCSEKQQAKQYQFASKTTMANQVIPELLPRNPKIGSPAEQEKVYMTYHKLKSEISRNPSNYRKRIQLAQLFMLEARATGEHGHYYPASLTILNGILMENPPKDVVFGVKSLKASVMLSLHEFKEARELAKEAIEINGYNALIYGSLVDAEVELGNYETAVAMADKMMSIRPDIRSYSRVSYLREIHGDMEGAIDAMKLAVKAGYPGYEETAWAGLILGQLLEAQGQLDRAEEVFKGILAERENYPFAIEALARIARKKGDMKKAERLLKDACAIIPEVSFYENLAKLYLETGRIEEAKKLNEEILEMLADDEAKGHKMGMEYSRVYLELFNDHKKALEYAWTEYEYRPQNKDANQLLAAIYLKMEDYKQAEKHLKVALATGSTNAELKAMEALVLHEKGQENAAKKLFKKYFNQDPYQDHIFLSEAKNMIGA
ncbi:MAG: tetratricopeptide repeat protein [Bacteroidia bacterium]|nr:tetratricopeptide repeat protein [Bacteroidia bacterium]